MYIDERRVTWNIDFVESEIRPCTICRVESLQEVSGSFQESIRKLGKFPQQILRNLEIQKERK